MLIVLKNVLIKSKPPNDRKWWVKIGDFGISKRAEDSHASTTIKGTFGYMAPEILLNSDSSCRQKTTVGAFPPDMWALGEITFRMLTGAPTFKSMVTMLRWAEAPDTEFLSQLELYATQDAGNLVRNLLQRDPNKRLTAAETIAHPWISSHSQGPPRSDSWTLPSDQNWPQLPMLDDISGFREASAAWTTLTLSTKTAAANTQRNNVCLERVSQPTVAETESPPHQRETEQAVKAKPLSDPGAEAAMEFVCKLFGERIGRFIYRFATQRAR
jgi:serine/threonine protein kinase